MYAFSNICGTDHFSALWIRISFKDLPEQDSTPKFKSLAWVSSCVHDSIPQTLDCQALVCVSVGVGPRRGEEVHLSHRSLLVWALSIWGRDCAE